MPGPPNASEVIGIWSGNSTVVTRALLPVSIFAICAKKKHTNTFQNTWFVGNSEKSSHYLLLIYGLYIINYYTHLIGAGETNPRVVRVVDGDPFRVPIEAMCPEIEQNFSG